MQEQELIMKACDPSLDVRGPRGDYSAIVMMAKDTHTERMYVIAADIARRTPDQTIDRIVDLARLRRFDEFTVEDNQFQTLMVDNLEKKAEAQQLHFYVHRQTSKR